MKDSETNIEELKKLMREFVAERDWEQFHTPKDLAIAISTEAAEILNHFRFRNGEDLEKYMADAENKKELSHELADVLAFLVRLADKTDVDLAAALKEKMEINGKRFPVETAKGKGWMDIHRKEVENWKKSIEQ